MSRLQIETELAGTCPIGMLGLLPMYEYVSWSVGRWHHGCLVVCGAVPIVNIHGHACVLRPGPRPKASTQTLAPCDICLHISVVCDLLQSFLAQWNILPSRSSFLGGCARPLLWGLSSGHQPAWGWRGRGFGRLLPVGHPIRLKGYQPDEWSCNKSRPCGRLPLEMLPFKATGGWVGNILGNQPRSFSYILFLLTSTLESERVMWFIFKTETALDSQVSRAKNIPSHHPGLGWLQSTTVVWALESLVSWGLGQGRGKRGHLSCSQRLSDVGHPKICMLWHWDGQTEAQEEEEEAPHCQGKQTQAWPLVSGSSFQCRLLSIEESEIWSLGWSLVWIRTILGKTLGDQRNSLIKMQDNCRTLVTSGAE